MKVEQLYTGCLAEAAYYIESNGEVAIIDPLRDPEPYIQLANENGAKIKYVLETHFHADFVSGHLDLAKKTGATIVYGPTANPDFEALVAEDNQELPLGNITLKVLHTPGHTMESTSYLLIDEDGKEHCVFTGDTLFIGDVGRPDLAVTSDISRDDLAGFLFDSLRNRIMPLPDAVIIYPNHGAGSACGKNMSDETWDTLGHQKEVNYTLRPEMTREEFIKAVTAGLVAPPQYFPKNAVLNKSGYESIDDVLAKGLRKLDVDSFIGAMEEPGVLVLDTRSKEDFPKAFIPNSVFIGIDDNFAPWVGALIEDLNTPILFIADPGKEKEVVTRLARVGYDNCIGFLNGGFDSWKADGQPYDTLKEISAEQFASQFDSLEGTTLDVRKHSEFSSEHVVGAENFPLDEIEKNAAMLNGETNYYVHCAGGYRSVIAASLLLKSGYRNITNIQGGYNALKECGLRLTEYAEPTTML
jgi:glyoxylase-like metal-dependent hydrolase (beta-lactamase superfamily II)/rhodanese-related sulfurtransferase